MAAGRVAEIERNVRPSRRRKRPVGRAIVIRVTSIYTTADAKLSFSLVRDVPRSRSARRQPVLYSAAPLIQIHRRRNRRRHFLYYTREPRCAGRKAGQTRKETIQPNQNDSKALVNTIIYKTVEIASFSFRLTYISD